MNGTSLHRSGCYFRKLRAIIDKKNDVREALNAGQQPENLLRDALIRGDDLTVHVLTGEPGRQMLQSRGVYLVLNHIG